MIIKVCGMRDAENIRQVDSLQGVDWMGFIFYPPSSRFVGDVPAYLPQHSKRVGVFVNEDFSNISHFTKTYGLHLVQLHGDESPFFCHELRSQLPPETKLVKMIAITSPEDLEKTRLYEDEVDYFLFETKCNSYGGSGQQFDWSILQHYTGQKPFLITGGIGGGDAEKVMAFRHPQFAGIDLNSRFENAPAVKDIEMIRQFIKQIKQ